MKKRAPRITRRGGKRKESGTGMRFYAKGGTVPPGVDSPPTGPFLRIFAGGRTEKRTLRGHLLVS